MGFDITKIFDQFSSLIDTWDNANYFVYAVIILIVIVVYLIFF